MYVHLENVLFSFSDPESKKKRNKTHKKLSELVTQGKKKNVNYQKNYGFNW